MHCNQPSFPQYAPKIAMGGGRDGGGGGAYLAGVGGGAFSRNYAICSLNLVYNLILQVGFIHYKKITTM